MPDRVTQLVIEHYGAVTGLPQDPGVSIRMTGYYAFSNRYQHTVSQQTPSVILEMGFVTNSFERRFLYNNPDVPAQGVVQALLRFLAEDDRLALSPEAWAFMAG